MNPENPFRHAPTVSNEDARPLKGHEIRDAKQGMEEIRLRELSDEDLSEANSATREEWQTHERDMASNREEAQSLTKRMAGEFGSLKRSSIPDSLKEQLLRIERSLDPMVGLAKNEDMQELRDALDPELLNDLQRVVDRGDELLEQRQDLMVKMRARDTIRRERLDKDRNQ
ncbi:MAG TPA: hypothetical protein VFY28_02030 [Candidatus Paceibacterota bacterium]|nr:hypothetical protein [Candidatus Paceibacterota bacterium]